MQKQSLLKKWFPTFVHLFEQFSTNKNLNQTENKPLEPVEKKVLANQPFFLQGLDDIESLLSFNREDFLQGLGWESNGLNEVAAPRAEMLQVAAVSVTQPDQAEFVKPQIVVQPIEEEPEASDFFLRGLRTVNNIENMKNMELLALLQWEEQGQTLLEVDPDDYDLLDDLLEAAEI